MQEIKRKKVDQEQDHGSPSDEEQLACEQDVTITEAQKALSLLKRYVYARPNPSEKYVECTIGLSTMLASDVSKKMQTMKQCKIYDFFANKT